MMPRAARRRAPRAVPGPSPAPARAASGFVIPFDYAAQFRITGQPGNLIQEAIAISPDGPFVAVAIGYGFEEDRGRDVNPTFGDQVGRHPTLPDPPPGTIRLGDVLLSEIPVDALIEGFRIRPAMRSLVFQGGELTTQVFAKAVAAELFERIKPPADIAFLFSMVDSGSGRELQDEPVHSLASLGKSNGERPFRPLAAPLTFMPRSTLRLQVIERSEGVQGTLFIVLYGYKMLAGSACPEPAFRALLENSRRAANALDDSRPAAPFDYVADFELTGRAGNQVVREITINAEGAFVATAVGYGLATRPDDVAIRFQMEPAVPARLRTLPLRLFPPDALSDGFRVRPSFHRIAFNTGANLLNAIIGPRLVNQVFERIVRAEDLSFRYTILDTTTGRELQNQPIHNVAGLGIANGDRPFKRLARPLVLLPRSTLRITLGEHFGEGNVFMAFQGYKVLAGSVRPG
jgi:hypothetical protein